MAGRTAAAHDGRSVRQARLLDDTAAYAWLGFLKLRGIAADYALGTGIILPDDPADRMPRVGRVVGGELSCFLTSIGGDLTELDEMGSSQSLFRIVR